MLKRIVYYLLGLTIACLGVSLIIHSQVGAGPWDIVNIGLTEKLGLTLGIWMALFQAFFLFVNAALLKKRPEFAAIVTLTLWGLLIDFWMEIIFRDLDLSFAEPMFRWSIFLIGVVLIGAGVGTYLTSNLPKMPYDGTMVAISQKYNISFTVSRTLLEGSAVLLSFIIGGSVGVGPGTIVIFLVIGQLIQVFHKLSMFIFHRKIGFFA
ncbi:YczE/YyaS/YitT family protein [Bacillus marasmi]|uniref:YczE/YyaS/YitT family protein n=1 Tax=Bacillus marasmi TaxID=1926279 RepID=UPI0011C71DF5|nr:BCR, YitT family protein [Bacillus marasmi]